MREHKERTREDDGHNAARIDSDGDYAVVYSVGLVSSLLVAVDDFDSSFGQVDKDYESEYDYYDYQIKDQSPNDRNVFRDKSELADDTGEESGKDTDEDYQRRTVSDAKFGNSIRQPHNDATACGQIEDNEYHRERERNGTRAAKHGLDITLVVPTDNDTDTLNDSETDTDVFGDLSKFFSSLLALLAQFLKRFDYQGKQLHNDECVNERDNSESEQRSVL